MKASGSQTPSTAPARAAAPPARARATAPEAEGLLGLQRAVGNRAVRGLLDGASVRRGDEARIHEASAPLVGGVGSGVLAPPLAPQAEDGDSAPAIEAARRAPFEISAGPPSEADEAADPALARLRVVMLADEVRDSGTRASAAVTSAQHVAEAGLGRRADRSTARIASDIERGTDSVAKSFATERTTWTAAFMRGEAAVAASKVLHQGLAWARGAAALVTMSGSVKQARDKVETSITDSLQRVAAIQQAQQSHVHERTEAIARSARALGEHKAASYHDEDTDLRSTKRAAVLEMASQFAGGVEAKEAEAKQSVADGLATLPDGFRSEGDKVKAQFDDPTPRLAPAVDDGVRATSELIRAQATAGREALNGFASSALAQLASGEQAVRTALAQLRTAATEQVRRAERSGRDAVRQAAGQLVAELQGTSADAAQALIAEQQPSVARARQLVGWVKQQQQLGAQRFADAMPAAIARLAQPMSDIVRATGARVRSAGARLADWLAVQRTSTTQQVVDSLAHVDDSLAAIVAGFTDVLADTQRQIQAKLDEATSSIDQKFQDATRGAERELAGKIDEAYGEVEASLPDLAAKMDDTVDQLDWDDRHPVLAVIRDVALFIAGELVGLLKLALKLVVGLLIAVIAIIALVIAGVSFAFALAVVAVAAIGLLVVQIGRATYRRHREAVAAGDDRGFWANLGLGFSDVAGLTGIYHAFTAKGLTPFERGEAYVEGVGDLAGVVLTVAGVRMQIKEIRIAAAEPVPYADGAALEGTQGLDKLGRALRIEQRKVADGGIPRIERARAIREGLTEAGASAFERVRSWARSGSAGKPVAPTAPPAPTEPAAATAPATTEPVAVTAPAPTEPVAVTAPAPTEPAVATAPSARPEPAATTEPAATPEPATGPGHAPSTAVREAVHTPPRATSVLERPSSLEPPSGLDPAVRAPREPAPEVSNPDGSATAPPPAATIFEPFVGDSLASPADLLARNPGSTVIAAEATLLPSAEQIATFQGRGGRFLTDRFGESLPANSVDELHVRYPLPHQKSTEMALHLTQAELADPLAAVQARMAAIESLHNLAPEALRTLQPDGTLEVVFAEKEIVGEVDGMQKLRWTDPETGAVYRFEVASAPRLVPRAEANAPYSGLGIPKTTSEVYVAKLRKAAVPEATRSVPEGAPGSGRAKLAPGTRSRQTEGLSEKYARPEETHGQILRGGKQLLEETVPGIEPQLRELVHPEASAADRLALETVDRKLEELANNPALTGPEQYKDLAPAARAERAALEQTAARLTEERAALLRRIEDSLHDQAEGNKTRAIALMARLRKALLGPELPARPRTTISPDATNAIRASGRSETDVLGDLAEHERLTGKPAPRTLDYEDPRAHYNRQRSSINVGDRPSSQTIMHEASHPIEYQDPEISKASQSFRDARGRFAASGEDAPVRTMRELTGDPKFREDEVGIEAGFTDKYTGKVYSPGDAATEVVTMGVQAFVDAPGMFTLYRQDPELFLFILGVLRRTRGASGR